ncbi:hypothetical protein VIGAN_04002200 [Vigna angularis var. angularis]|uniref:Uncharacterized protein n=1 Tax=Vigna angularis var. angularis TaxID=157739 RepID=A0A0S3RQV9_PHAAN|nr:hypothetical protein VIGAN_04002200 [Vigna angularis var. angularis]
MSLFVVTTLKISTLLLLLVLPLQTHGFLLCRHHTLSHYKILSLFPSQSQSSNNSKWSNFVEPSSSSLFSFSSMDHFLTLLLFLTSLFASPVLLIAQTPSPIISHITVVGAVYCDTCSISTFSKQSYFLQGVEVHIQCRFRATSPKTNDQISFSVNRTTDQNGVYKLEIPSVDGVNCMDGSAIVSLCQASLISSSTSTCNVPMLKSTTREISVKSKQDNMCVYTLSGLSFKPPQKNSTLCGHQNEKLSSEKSLYPSEFFFFPWPPQLPPFPSFPFPPLPFPTSPPIPSLPFPFPQYPPTPPAFSPPAFNLGDPSTWIPHIPPSPPPYVP